MAYDLLNRDTSATAPGRGTSRTAFNDAARAVTFTDALGQQYTTIANALGAPIQRRSPANPSLSDLYRYDSDGHLSSFTTRAGRTGQILHDVLGRDTLITADGAAPTRVSYDPARKWITYGNAESTDTSFVDGAGRVSRQVSVRDGVPYVIVSSFGPQGDRQLLAVSSPVWSGAPRTLLFSVDSLGRPSKRGDFASTDKGTTITYNADHLPQTITLPTGTTTASRLRQTLSYAGNDRLSGVTANYAPDVLSWSYHHDALDRTWLIAQGEGMWAGVRSVDYDAAGRVSHWSDSRTVELPGQWICDDPRDESSCYMYYGTESQVVRDSTYAYDAVGNRTDLGAAVQPGNRLTSFNGVTMTYDDDGNLLTKTGPGLSQSFAWNGLGQLVSVTTNGNVTTFGYDGLGRRVRKTHNGVTTRYLYDGEDLVMQLDAAGARQLEFSYYPGVDAPLAVRSVGSGATYWYATGQPGSVTALVNAANQVVNRYEYTPFGSELSKTEQIVQPFRFAARQFDSETGLYYNRARYYDPAVGRFISEDPIGLAGGVNPYGYAGNDPVNGADPFGLEPCTQEQLAGGAIEARFSDGNVVCKEGTGLPPIVVSAQAPPSTWPSIIGMGVDWGLGTGDTYRYFGAGSGQVADMQSAPGVKFVRSVACAAGVHSFKTDVDFGRPGYRAAGTNATRQFVGSYHAFVSETSTGDIRFHLSNRTSLGSFIPHDQVSIGRYTITYGVPGWNWERSRIAPLGNMYQDFVWTESRSEACH